jgi:RNA polymerase sigma-70 factor (ECF subfamily)
MADIGGWGELHDEQLISLAVESPAAADRARAFTAIYHRHGQAVLRFCSGWLGDPLLVGDVVQETFTAAFVELRRGCPPADTSKLRPWLLGIARHRCLQAVQRRHETPHDGIVEPAPDGVEGSNRRLAEVERLLLVVADTSTPKQRKVFDLAVRQGLRGRRLAEILGVKPAQASRLTNEVIHLAHEGFGALAAPPSSNEPKIRAAVRSTPRSRRPPRSKRWTGRTATRSWPTSFHAMMSKAGTTRSSPAGGW